MGLGGPLGTDCTVNGALYGGQVSYNWQHGLMVYGVEGSFSGSTIRAHGVRCLPRMQTRSDWLATVTGRVVAMAGRYYTNGRRRLSDVPMSASSTSHSSAAHFTWLDGAGWFRARFPIMSRPASNTHISTSAAPTAVSLPRMDHSNRKLGQSQDGHHPARRERRSSRHRVSRETSMPGGGSCPAFSYVIPTSERRLAVTP